MCETVWATLEGERHDVIEPATAAMHAALSRAISELEVLSPPKSRHPRQKLV